MYLELRVVNLRDNHISIRQKLIDFKKYPFFHLLHIFRLAIGPVQSIAQPPARKSPKGNRLNFRPSQFVYNLQRLWVVFNPPFFFPMISGKLYPSYSTSCILPPTRTTLINLHLPLLKISSTLRLISFQSVSLSFPTFFSSKSTAKSTRFSNSVAKVYSYEGQNPITLSDLEDLSENGVVYKKTLAMVECSMFAALNGLVYFLSNSLALEVCSSQFQRIPFLSPCAPVSMIFDSLFHI